MNTKCYTFYSYKGGSGRSTALINTAKHLIPALKANPQEPILIVDADLESAGLTYFFGCASRFGTLLSSDDLVEDALTINTAGLLLQGQNRQLRPNSVQANMIFGNVGESRGPIPEALIEKFSVILKYLGNYDIHSVLKGVELSNIEVTLFNKIADMTLERFEQKEKNDGVVEGEIYYLTENYNLIELLADFIEIQHKNAASSATLKREKIDEFLPVRKLCDISSFFDAQPGTVRFLGVDVKSKVGSVYGHSAEEATATSFKALLKVCNSLGYKAVIFDSAAGTQSTAHALHYVSDVIVYCMRPTRQFLQGTRQQLTKYKDEIVRMQSKYNKSPVIILPTAVPYDSGCASFFKQDSFLQIEGISQIYSSIVDGTFCTDATSLHEVELFKWYEMILGCGNGLSSAADGAKSAELKKYTLEATMPADAKNAYKTYRKLAERIVYDSVE